MPTAALTSGCDSSAPTLSFEELPHGLNEHLSVAPGYQYEVLIRWGDPIFNNSIEFDPYNQTKESQLSQFGYNNDFIGYVPLPLGSTSSSSALLSVNHEYTVPKRMQPDTEEGNDLPLEKVDVDMASYGLSIIEIKKESDNWQVLLDSSYNRRISLNTLMHITGPAAGNERMKTALSDDGVKTFGTFYNCAGGVTPWGTILTAEENVDDFFGGDAATTVESESHARFGINGDTTRYSWFRYYDRWDVNKSPQEPFHLGWVVEIDPYDPDSIPKKRSALGRYKHEGCNIHINPDNSVVAYSGDDEHFEYVYRFISDHTYDANNREANMRLLEDGTLYAAKFNEDGTLDWLPLVFGNGPLTAKNGFVNQGDVLIDARKAADLMGATPMDRPEGIQVNSVTGKVYASFTNNSKRSEEQTDSANPRAENRDGQILEFWPSSGHHSEDVFKWNMFLLAGDPSSDVSTQYHPDTSENGWFACPDNLAFDNLGNMWIATDGAQKHNVADGIWATAVEGSERALPKRFIRGPIDAELTGPCFSPDNQSFFCSVQHPGEGDTFQTPSTRWPDFDENMPPRPAVVVVTKIGGGRIGS